MLYKSKNTIASKIFESAANADDKKRPITTCVQFKNSVSALMDALRLSKQHYVRCIKPNESKKGGLFEEKMVVNQVQYLGLLENVKVRRAGYAFRMPYDRFLSKYKCVAKKHMEWYDNAKEGVTFLVKDLGLEKDVTFGKTKLFIRSPKSIFSMEEARMKFLMTLAGQIDKSHHDDIIWADKVFGFDKNCKRVPLHVAIAAQGVHVFDGKKLLHRAPLTDFNGITLPEGDGWMVMHLLLGPQGKQEEFVYLVENCYKVDVEAVLGVLKACSTSLNIYYSSTIPLAASDPKEAKRQQKEAAAAGKKCIIL